ncbi:MAG: hypothetical protein HYX32_11825 [Actinobacteria bacterium]|nr:hypothetical protein [Actinomycetota bacterium]
MDLHLTDDDAGLLQEVLSGAFRDLRFEIADTDNHEFKHRLKAREAALKAILDQVGGLLPA